MQLIILLAIAVLTGSFVIKNRIDSINETSSKLNTTIQTSPSPQPTIKPVIQPSTKPVYNFPSFKPLPSIKPFPSLLPLPTLNPSLGSQIDPTPIPSDTTVELSKEYEQCMIDYGKWFKENALDSKTPYVYNVGPTSWNPNGYGDTKTQKTPGWEYCNMLIYGHL